MLEPIAIGQEGDRRKEGRQPLNRDAARLEMRGDVVEKPRTSFTGFR